MSFKVIGKTTDLRSGAHVIYCQSSIQKYLDIVGENFDDFNIQRRRENHKAYKRLKMDLKEGALIPSITLSVKHHLVDEIIGEIENANKMEEILSQNNTVDILDGLQRTYILKDLQSEGVEFQENQKILLEFWLEKSLSKLIYRMIVLNAGQKPMSMKHQIDLLFMSLQKTISEQIPGIEIIVEKDVKRRTQPTKYHLSAIAASYHAFLTASHETDKENLIAQKLLDDDALDSSEEELTEKFNQFMTYFQQYVKIDQLCWEKYSQLNPDTMIENVNSNQELSSEEVESEIEKINNLRDSHGWFGSENVMLSIFSAISQFIKHPKKTDRVDISFSSLITSINDPDIIDPLGIIEFESVKKGLNPRKTNIGYATRKLISTGIKEYFRDGGETSLSTCWLMSVE